jgi:glutathione S-transferase
MMRVVAVPTGTYILAMQSRAPVDTALSGSRNTPILVTLPLSHFCEKARWALDWARVVYREEGHVPGLHRRAVRRVRGRAGSVPVLVVDGDVFDDSPAIMRWADRRASDDRKLLPPGGDARDEALALEHHFDVDLAPHVRRFSYFHLLPNRSGTLGVMDVATPRAERAVLRVTFPVIRTLMRRTMYIDAPHAVRSRDLMCSIFDEIDKRLADGRPYLMGDRFGAVDIAFAAFTAPLVAPVEHPVYGAIPPMPRAFVDERDALRERAAGQFVLRVYRDHRGPVRTMATGGRRPLALEAAG